MSELLHYLHDFTQRIRPLMDISEEMDKVRTEFGPKFDAGDFPGWPKETGGALAHTGAHLDLSAFSSPEELASLGLDRLKSALMALGLKCGGTLEDRANRLFMTKGKRLADIDPSMFAKNKAKSGKNFFSSFLCFSKVMQGNPLFCNKVFSKVTSCHEDKL